MFRPIGLVALLTAVALSGCKSVPPPPQTWKFTGFALVERKCGGCHAVDMEHLSINSDAPPLRELYRRHPIDGLEEAFARGLKIGHYDMPRFKLEDDERAEVLSYLRLLDPCFRPSIDAEAMRHCIDTMPNPSPQPAR
jgi:mono/diheme cytochrome c family protein